jgi:hypothetical protein
MKYNKIEEMFEIKRIEPTELNDGNKIQLYITKCKICGYDLGNSYKIKNDDEQGHLLLHLHEDIQEIKREQSEIHLAVEGICNAITKKDMEDLCKNLIDFANQPEKSLTDNIILQKTTPVKNQVTKETEDEHK